MLDHADQAVLVVRTRHHIGGSLNFRLSVAHRHAQPRILDHGQIVKTIAAGDYVLAFQSKALDQARDRRALVHAGAA